MFFLSALTRRTASCPLNARENLAHELPVSKACLNHSHDIVIGQTGIRADADHVVDHQFDGGIGGGMGPQVVALGHEGTPTLAVEI